MSASVQLRDRVTVEIRDGVADVRLTRVDKLNALDNAMFDALIAAGERLKIEPGVRAVVLSGEGRAFCAGLDMSNFIKMASGGGMNALDLIGMPRTPGGANRPQHAVMVWREIAVPVIAAIHGVAFGGGLQLALGPDVRFIAPDTKLAMLEIKWGLVPDMGGISLLRGLVRDDIARELIYSGRIFMGNEAGQIGIATRVCTDPKAEALLFARQIADRNPNAIRAAKRLLNLSAHTKTDQAGILIAESEEQVSLLGSSNQTEAVDAALKDRRAIFAD